MEHVKLDSVGAGLSGGYIAMSEEVREKVIEEIVDFWINFIYGESIGSLETANNNTVNLRHLKRILGIEVLEKKLDYELTFLKEFDEAHEHHSWNERIEALEASSASHTERPQCVHLLNYGESHCVYCHT